MTMDPINAIAVIKKRIHALECDLESHKKVRDASKRHIVNLRASIAELDVIKRILEGNEPA